MTESIEQALTRLRKDPRRSVRARLDDFEIEIHVVDRASRPKRLGDRVASLGPWSGESPEEISTLITEARRGGGAAEPPAL
ncbi:MAG: hypothetical protein PHU25_11815 [Deltaproteobacteria bacterium]|nr:hypothetical protein [Deltaproteobacteria bacterium]